MNLFFFFFDQGNRKLDMDIEGVCEKVIIILDHENKLDKDGCKKRDLMGE